MNRVNYILPECYVDTNLVNALVGGMCNHKKGCATVCKSLDKEFADKFAVAVIDKDKREPKQVSQFTVLAEKDGIVVCKHKQRPHYLIEINPAIEVFILNAVNELQLSLSSYGLPDDINALKKLTKSVNAKESQVFTRLFRDLQKASNVSRLHKVLIYLVDNQYQTKSEGLVEILK